MKKHAVTVAVVTAFFTLASCAGLCLIVDRMVHAVVDSEVEDKVTMMVEEVQSDVVSFNAINFSLIHMASSLPFIKDTSVSLKEKDDQLYCLRYGNPTIIGLNITDLQGNSWTDHQLMNFSERPYFKNALQGKETVFGPIINKVTLSSTIFYGAPHYDVDGNLVNTFFLASHGENLTKICEQHESHQSKLHPAIVRRSTGLVIGTTEPGKVMQANIFDDSSETGVKALSDLSADIADGKTGYKVVKMPDGSVDVHGYAPINGTDWAVIVKARYSDFSAPVERIHLVMLVFSGIMLLAAVVVSLIAGRHA